MHGRDVDPVFAQSIAEGIANVNKPIAPSSLVMPMDGSTVSGTKRTCGLAYGLPSRVTFPVTGLIPDLELHPLIGTSPSKMPRRASGKVFLTKSLSENH